MSLCTRMNSRWILIQTLLCWYNVIESIDVSVCGDATFDIPESRGIVCVGSGTKPFGAKCPRKNDRAHKDCVSSSPSFQNVGLCVALEDAVCKIVERDTWGCVFPSVQCTKSKSVLIQSACANWSYDGHNANELEMKLLEEFEPKAEEESDSWFVQESAVSSLKNDCLKEPSATSPPVESDSIIFEEPCDSLELADQSETEVINSHESVLITYDSEKDTLKIRVADEKKGSTDMETEKDIDIECAEGSFQLGEGSSQPGEES